MPVPGRSGRTVGQPRQPLGLRGHVDDAQRQTGAGQRTAQDEQVVAELAGDIGDDAVVGGGGAGQHRHARRQQLEDASDAAVVGSEVVAPVADAVGLVDDEQTAAGTDDREHLVAEAAVGEPLG